ncbi:bacillithiol biosynthesis cysteine-adding enzyme BshC [Paenibacillus sp. Cedars]|uniref:bacillithiol biosynthesis cysteine-adding enzyme BshC n=1 Tax=Paenibacillus sp. Cedars TaxID=1980674 RepID=UPI00116352B5|nr:bacillithiol biosynthesis cysteine-adding enzyme BshC [Paenibacillus sp. Cedars]AWP28853.1 bacillithiol biosynthesis cysteine-adding enzyme BshC [Paenibacillus sp. Cedars]
MNIVPEPLSLASRLAQDYIHHFERVSGFYGEDHRSEHGYAERVKWLDLSEDKRVQRKVLVDCLRTYNQLHNDHPAVHTSLQLLEQPGTVTMVGGQQSGLFTGPLLVIYKAITVIQAAREAEERLNRPVVPVFWIAGEDHDWDEVNHTFFLRQDQQISKIKLDAKDGLRTSVSYTGVAEEDWNLMLSELQTKLSDSEYKADILKLARDACNGSRGLSEAFAKLINRLFGKYGLILLDSADPGLRALEVPVFESLITHNETLGLSYQQAARDIKGLGYDVQADVSENGANLFYLHEGRRLLLYREGNVFSDRKGMVTLTEQELLRDLHAHPERFSNNVLTRPIMQDCLLPVLGTILGPGEISYWAITRYAFADLGLQMPLIIPRMSFSIVDGTVHKLMEKYEISFEDVHNRLDKKRETWLASKDELNLEDRFSKTREQFEALYQPLIEDLGRMQSGLLKLGLTNKDKILEQMDYLLSKSRNALEQQHEAALAQWKRIEQTLLPEGKPQERVYNILEYMNRYGLNLVDSLMEIPYESSGIHRVVYV